MADSAIDVGLMLLWGICWTIVYLALIYKGFREKTYGVPAFALFCNLSWEFIFAFIMPFVQNTDMGIQLYISILWFLCDALILCTYLLYGKKYFPRIVDRRWFLPWTILGLTVSFLFVLLISYEFNDYIGVYSAFMGNLVMSVLFIDMLVKRGNGEGQSLGIATLKCIGTLAPTIYFYRWLHDTFVLYLGVSCFIFDVIYIVLLYDITIRAARGTVMPSITIRE